MIYRNLHLLSAPNRGFVGVSIRAATAGSAGKQVSMHNTITMFILQIPDLGLLR